MNLKRAMLGVSLLSMAGLAACQTAPDPVVQQPVQVTPPPVFEEPAPPPVVQAPVETAPPVVVTPDPNLPQPGSAADFAYQVGGEPRVFFGYDQFDLSAQARANLARQADWMNRYPEYSAIIEGHADERGTREYNLALGAKRAESVRSYLVSQGVNPTRLRTVSYGKERPIDGRSSESGWSRNRNGFTNLNTNGIG